MHGSHCGARHSSITHSLTGLFRYVVYSKSIFGLTELSVRHAGLTWHFAAGYGRVDSQDYTEISIPLADYRSWLFEEFRMKNHKQQLT